MFVVILNVESVEIFVDFYIIFVKYFGILDYYLISFEIDKRENLKEIIQCFKILIVLKVYKFLRWLLIVDNVVELKVIYSFLF